MDRWTHFSSSMFLSSLWIWISIHCLMHTDKQLLSYTAIPYHLRVNLFNVLLRTKCEVKKNSQNVSTHRVERKTNGFRNQSILISIHPFHSSNPSSIPSSYEYNGLCTIEHLGLCCAPISCLFRLLVYALHFIEFSFHHWIHRTEYGCASVCTVQSCNVRFIIIYSWFTHNNNRPQYTLNGPKIANWWIHLEHWRLIDTHSPCNHIQFIDTAHQQTRSRITNVYSVLRIKFNLFGIAMA